jgi:integrase
MKYRIHPIARKLGIPTRLVTFQVLRRTAATDMQNFGGVKDAQSVLRHKTSQTTLDYYIQPVDGTAREAVEARSRAVAAAIGKK